MEGELWLRCFRLGPQRFMYVPFFGMCGRPKNCTDLVGTQRIIADNFAGLQTDQRETFPEAVLKHGWGRILAGRSTL